MITVHFKCLWGRTFLLHSTFCSGDPLTGAAASPQCQSPHLLCRRPRARLTPPERCHAHSDPADDTRSFVLHVDSLVTDSAQVIVSLLWVKPQRSHWPGPLAL